MLRAKNTSLFKVESITDILFCLSQNYINKQYFNKWQQVGGAALFLFMEEGYLTVDVVIGSKKISAKSRQRLSQKTRFCTCNSRDLPFVAFDYCFQHLRHLSHSSKLERSSDIKAEKAKCKPSFIKN